MRVKGRSRDGKDRGEEEREVTRREERQNAEVARQEKEPGLQDETNEQKGSRHKSRGAVEGAGKGAGAASIAGHG